MVRFNIAYWPVAMITRERTYRASLIPKPPSILRILCDRTDPNGICAQRIKITLVKFLMNARDIPPLVVCSGVYGSVLNRLIVGGVAVKKAIHHSEIHDRCVPVPAV